ncbi:MAG: Type secretion system secretin RcpA/CpaC, associated with Flp pilus assembly [Labilithrix sp.]|nr:Type secretion system secretin RcpA/CpaC, associated with Flp pilus assembly [Labilithrix sp.]
MIPAIRHTSAVLLTALGLLVPSASSAAPTQDRSTSGAGTADTAGENEVVLAVGENKTVSAKDVRNYSEGSPGVIDVKLTTDNSQFVLAGRKPGSTTMLLIKNDGTQVTLTIHVFARPPGVVEKELNQLLDGLNGVHVKRVGARIVMDGVVATDVEMKRVQHIATLYPNQVESLVTLPGGGGGTSAADSKYIVRIDFYFVQYDKNSSYGVGLGWPGSIGGDQVVKSTVTFDFIGGSRAATAAITNQPIPRLDIASRKGWAKVLKQATVVTNNGVEANFQNGGEQNFTVNTGLTVGVQRIQFGTDVTVLPRYNPQKREIEMKLVADVSDLTASAGATSLPGRTTSKLTTNITLRLGQSIVLSGIRTKSQAHSVTGLPGLSSIPVLGLLFGSHADEELQTEGAIFVVPNVVEAVPTQTSEMVDSAIAKFEGYSGALDKTNVYDKRPGAQPRLSR